MVQVNASTTQKIFFLLLLLLFVYFILPFIPAIAMGGVFAILFFPFLKKQPLKHLPRALSALLLTAGLTLTLFLPLSGILFSGVKSGLHQIKHFQRIKDPQKKPIPMVTSEKPPEQNLEQNPEINHEIAPDFIDKIFLSTGFHRVIQNSARFFFMDPAQLTLQIKDLISILINKLGETVSSGLTQLPTFAIEIVIFLFCLFYFLMDGEKLLAFFREYSFYNERYTEKFFKKFHDLCRSVILASLISGASQAFLASLAALIIGNHQVPLVFLIVFVGSFIPLIGSAPITLGLAGYELFNGHMGASIFMGSTALVISTIDNFIRPYVISGSSNLHPLLGFLSALGGLQVLGLPGAFLGPILCGLIVELAQEMKFSRSRTS